jgi:hypothetical protein
MMAATPESYPQGQLPLGESRGTLKVRDLFLVDIAAERRQGKEAGDGHA